MSTCYEGLPGGILAGGSLGAKDNCLVSRSYLWVLGLGPCGVDIS